MSFPASGQPGDRCPRCGAARVGGDCPACRAWDDDNPYAAPQALAPAGRPRTRFRLVDLLAIVVVVAVVLSLMRDNSVGGVLLAAVALPATVRVIVAVRRWRDRGETVDRMRVLVVSVQSFGIALLTVLAIGAAFVGACFPVGLASAATNVLGSYFFVVGVIAGLVAAVYVMRWLRATLWPIDPPPPPEAELSPGGGIRFLDSRPAGPGEVRFREFDPHFNAEASSHASTPPPVEPESEPESEPSRGRAADPGPDGGPGGPFGPGGGA